MAVQIGRKWDLTSCTAISATTSSFDINSWPRGDHDVAADYSEAGNCTEDPATCLAEMVAAVNNLVSGTYNLKHDWYDPYDRLIFTLSGTGYAIVSWIGRFGEINLPIEIYRPGRYKLIETIDGTPTTHYFDVYIQTTNKYLHKQGNDYGSGNSWGAAKASYYSAQAALTAGNIIYIGEADYSNETGISFIKTQTLTPVKATWGGFPNLTSNIYAGAGDSGASLIVDVGNPIEMDGTIDRWAYYSWTGSSHITKLKIYRGGNAGTSSASTSTLIYTSDPHTESTGGWKTYTISPAQSVQRGDIIGIQIDETYNNVGMYRVIDAPSGSNLTAAAVVAGDPSNTTLGGLYYRDYAVMLRAWNSGTNFEIGLPIY